MNKKGFQFTLQQIVMALLVLFFVIVILLIMPKSIYQGAKSIVDSVLGIVEDKSNQIDTDITSGGDLVLTTKNTAVKIASPQGSLAGANIAEKIVNAAKEAGLSKQDAELILKLVSQESQFRHCCKIAGNNKGFGKSNCEPTNDEVCDESKILVSYDGSSRGALQLNIKESSGHPVWFTTSEAKYCSNPIYKLDCNIKESAGCKGRTAYEMDCNIRIGIRYLIWAKARYGDGKEYICKNSYCNIDTTYAGWDAAFRAYNGWGCPSDNQCKYVDEVNQQNIATFVPNYQEILTSAYG